MTMFERSDGFAALPGGIGTLEELVEISTWAQLDRHSKPIILCNIEKYWTPLLTLFDHMRREKFIRAGLEVKFEVVERVEDVIPAFDYRLSITQGKVPVEPLRKTL
jgi:uncharacterized protein (TIGR00730 family)